MNRASDRPFGKDEPGFYAADVVEPPPLGLPPRPHPQRNLSSRPPVSWSELLSVLLLVIVSDVTVFRGHGYAGIACLLAVAPWLFMLGKSSAPLHSARWWVGGMLVLLVARLLWCGSALAVMVGFALLVAWGMTMAGLCPYVVATIVFASQAIAAGFRRLADYGRHLKNLGPLLSRIAWLNFLLPLGAALVFGAIFILANPDLMESVWSGAERFLTDLIDWLAYTSVMEVAFCLAVLWISLGLLRPLLTETEAEESSDASAESSSKGGGGESAPAALYPAFRNTLAVVIILFAVYLVFEFQSLWFRQFPHGFHYSGYAHRGAAWLTMALALATGLLSLIFRGEIMSDPWLPSLKRLAWIWSAQNLVLAIAAFHRLFIYVGFNGLTQMRIVGIFGTATVVAGFLLVLWKIAHHRNLTWLVRRQLWALAAAVFLYAVTPVDVIWVRYNVRRILAGDPAPSVELSEHAIDNEGILFLLPLVDCENPIIREGIRAKLADRLDEVESESRDPNRRHWTAFQIVNRVVLERLRSASSQWSEYQTHERRQEALLQFHRYAYQWY